MSKNKKLKILNSVIIIPYMFEMFIFLTFRFADWRNALNTDIQIRIFLGAFVIVLFFAVYDVSLFVLIKKYYLEKDKLNQLLKTGFFGALGLMTYLISYFVRY